MTLPCTEEGGELIGAPDASRFNVTITRALRAVGWIGCQQFVDMHCICECLAQSAMYVRNGPCRQWPSIVAAVLSQIAVELRDHGRAQGLESHPSDAWHGAHRQAAFPVQPTSPQSILFVHEMLFIDS
jgi:hypothetical protein